jgi:hypothetical protein
MMGSCPTAYEGGVQMNPVLMVCLSVGAPLAAMGLYQLQTSLERWDHKRHERD